MKVTLDTNVLVRAVVADDPTQASAAADIFRQADVIAVSTPALCEFAWVLRTVYKYKRQQIARAVEGLLAIPVVRIDRPAAEAGLKMLRAGGDLADGVLAYEGRRLGGEMFVSFDRKAVALLQGQGESARLLA